jgi:DNA-binding transcriptional ArsR family regulator
MATPTMRVGFEHGFRNANNQLALQQMAKVEAPVAVSSEQIKRAVDPVAIRVFWYLFAGSCGGPTRVRIVNLLRERPYSRTQLARTLELDYKSVQHHLDVLKKNNLTTRHGEKYGVLFFISPYLEAKIDAFDEVVSKITRK